VLVGFSWEQAFAGGVEVIVEETCPHVHGHIPWHGIMLRLGMALIMGAGVIPAWQMYILKSLLVLREQYHEKKEHGNAEDKHEVGNDNPYCLAVTDPDPESSENLSRHMTTTKSEKSQRIKDIVADFGELPSHSDIRTMGLFGGGAEEVSTLSSSPGATRDRVFSDRMNDILVGSTK